MKRLEGPEFDPYRIPMPPVIRPPGMNPLGNERNGAFVFLDINSGVELRIIASNGGSWDHVSVHAFTSGQLRVPTYPEMDWVKRKFFKASETAMQLHVAEHKHINNHPHVLHLWRPHKGTIPLPPEEYV